MLFLQIYLVLSAIAFVGMLRVFDTIPDGPSHMASAILFSLAIGLTWPLMFLAAAVEMSYRKE